MFCSKKTSKKINSVHERSLRIILNDYQSPYSLLLEESHQITFHQRFINSLMIEICKNVNGHSPHIMNDISKLRGTFSNILTSSRQETFIHWNTDSMLFHVVLANSGNKCLLTSMRQLLWLFFKVGLGLGNVKILHVDLSKYLFKMLDLYDQGPLVTDGNISIN